MLGQPGPQGAKRAIIVGGGVAGLSAAIQLARAGLRVRLLERAAHLGGKLRELHVGGRRVPGGPSVFTMRWVFEELFDGRLDEALRLVPLDPLCRHFFPDGSVLDLSPDPERSRAAIASFASARDADGYLKFRRHAATIFGIVRGHFMERPVPPWSEFLKPRILVQMPRIDALRSLWDALSDFFPDPRLRQLFGRYATYNGSSPFHAPATLSVIAHVENDGGIFAVEGGIVRLAEALAARARALGVELATGVEVAEIVLDGNPKAPRAVGVRVGEGAIERADVVVAACDVAHLHERLVPASAQPRDFKRAGARYSDEELSLSAFLLLAAAPLPSSPSLIHHNVFFSRDYAHEFRQLIDERRAPDDPTVYLCLEDRDEREAGMFFLSNAPPKQQAGAAIDWRAEAPRARARILEVLARHGWALAPRAERLVTPDDFDALFPSSRGAIYGLASNSRMAAFKRPTNRVPGVAGLYAVGGTVHPGAGLPMVALSARITAALVREDLGP
jgi:1-hydroxycarotenoid 3,4-desaturase